MMNMEICFTRVSLKFTPTRGELEIMSTELHPPDAIGFLLLSEPNMTVAEISEKLHRLGIDVPTGICIAAIKSHFRKSLDVIVRAGLLRNRSPELPNVLRVPGEDKREKPKRLKRSRQKQLTRHDQRHGYDHLRKNL